MLITQASIRDFLRRKQLVLNKDGNWWDEMMPIFESLCTEYVNPEKYEYLTPELLLPKKIHIIEFDELEKYKDTKGLIFVLGKLEGNEIVLKCYIESIIKNNKMYTLSLSDRYHPQCKLTYEQLSYIHSFFPNYNSIRIEDNHITTTFNIANVHKYNTLSTCVSVYNIAKQYINDKDKLEITLKSLKNKKYISSYQQIEDYMIIDNCNFLLERNYLKAIIEDIEEIFNEK